MQNQNKLNSNRGGALLSVIIAMTVVGILAAVVLSISFTNFQMKQVDKKSKDNFYSAESVLDEVMVGLQNEVSQQFTKAYTYVLENYGYYTSSAEMRTDFETEFVLNMVDALSKTGDPNHYDIALLESYVRAAALSAGSYTVSSIYKGVDANDDPIYENYLETVKDGLILRNVMVTYTEQSYVNTITTDIKVTIPGLQFSLVSNMPKISDFCLIAQQGLFTQARAYLSLKGKAFAGAGIDLANSSLLDVEYPSSLLLITEGDVTLNGSARLNTHTTTSLWAKSITTKGKANTLSLVGRTYVKDDTTINGSDNTLVLANQYFGYSDSSDKAGESSAIIINGGNTTLDMTSLKSLVVAGTAFVSTQGTDEDNKDVLMGDSIAVKGNQVAYLLPVECFPTDAEGRYFATNPMSYSQYAALNNIRGWEENAKEKVLSSVKRSLASYGEVDIIPIFTPRAGGTVYIYINFERADAAAKYAIDYYGSDAGAKLQNYLDRYVKEFHAAGITMERIMTIGNYLIPLEEAENKAAYGSSIAGVNAQEMLHYKNSYDALCSKLVENISSLTSDELEKTVYENIIDANKLSYFLTQVRSGAGLSANVEADAAGKTVTIWSTDAHAADEVRCIVVDNAGGAAYTVPAGGKGIIIATGDVFVNSNNQTAWEGLIISNGKATMQGGTETRRTAIVANETYVSQALRLIATVGTEEYSGSGFFVDGSDFTVGDTSDAEGARVDVRDCLSFENWKSE